MFAIEKGRPPVSIIVNYPYLSTEKLIPALYDPN